MNKKRSLKQLGAVLIVILTAAFSALTLSAQHASPIARGEFTLTHEVRWGKAVLPPGDYSLTVTTVGAAPYVTVRGTKQSTYVMTAATSPCQSCAESQLIILNRKGERKVQLLQLARAGAILYFGPRREVDEALARAPKDTEQVEIVVASK